MSTLQSSCLAAGRVGRGERRETGKQLKRVQPKWHSKWLVSGTLEHNSMGQTVGKLQYKNLYLILTLISLSYSLFLFLSFYAHFYICIYLFLCLLSTCRDETLEALSDAQVVAPAAQTVDLHSADHRNSYLYVFDYQTRFGDYPQVCLAIYIYANIYLNYVFTF